MGMIDEKDAARVLDSVYARALDGIPNLSRSVDDLASDYLAKADSPEKAARSLAMMQVAKCGTSGFLTGLGGMLTLPVSVPANVGSVLYMQVRMIAAIARMGGYDTRSDQVQTMVYMCLTGTAVSDVIKGAGIQVGAKSLKAAFAKIPGKTLTKINQAVGYRLITKAGTKGVVNLGKLVPVAGGVIGGAWDCAATSVIAGNAIKMFIENENPDGNEEVVVVDLAEVVVEEDSELL